LLSLARDRITFSQRGGLPNWTSYPDGLVNATALHSQREGSVLVGGVCNYIYDLDLTCKGRVLRVVPSGSNGVTLFRTSPSNSRYLYTADNQGNVHCRDPASLTIQHTLCCPFGTIMDFDVCSNLLVTCGHSQPTGHNRMGQIRSPQNRFVQIYDLRMMKAAAPLQPKFDPRFLRFIPTFTSRLLIFSTTGDLVIVEPSDIIPPSAQYYKLDAMGGTFQDVSLSSSTQAIAFGTSSGYVHVWSSRQQPVFNHLSRETEWPQIDNSYPSIPMTDETTPFSIIPNPFLPQGETLLSDWPEELIQRKSYRPRPIDPEILATMSVIEKIGYAPKPGK
jgi:PAB-dependent poly(A)-specific ribonuclease subunit 2